MQPYSTLGLSILVFHLLSFPTLAFPQSLDEEEQKVEEEELKMIKDMNLKKQESTKTPTVIYPPLLDSEKLKSFISGKGSPFYTQLPGKFFLEQMDGFRLFKDEKWIEVHPGLIASSTRMNRDEFQISIPPYINKLKGTSIERPIEADSSNDWIVLWKPETNELKPLKNPYGPIRWKLNDGSLIYYDVQSTYIHTFKVTSEGAVIQSPLNKTHIAGWDYTPDEKLFYTIWDGMGKVESPYYSDYTPGAPYTLYYSSDGKTSQKLITARAIIHPRFVNNGQDIVYFEPGNEIYEKDQITPWLLKVINIQTKKVEQIDECLQPTKLFGETQIRFSSPTLISWLSSPWIFYTGDSTRDPEFNYLYNVTTKQKIAFRSSNIIGMQWKIDSYNSEPNSYGSSPLIVIQTERPPYTFLQAWEVPSLKEAYLARFETNNWGVLYWVPPK